MRTGSPAVDDKAAQIIRSKRLSFYFFIHYNNTYNILQMCITLHVIGLGSRVIIGTNTTITLDYCTRHALSKYHNNEKKPKY